MNFVVIFPELENVHLIKDVGMIPYVMYKEYGYNAFIASYDNSDLEYLDNEVLGLRQIRIKKCHSKAFINGCLFLVGQAKQIDILNVYHLSNASCFWVRIYKLLNRRGRVYLKFDTNYEVAKRLLEDSKNVKHIKGMLRRCDLISCETKDVKRLFEDQMNCKIYHLPNGVLEESIHFDLTKKEKIILTVGRLGTVEKNSELLLDAFVEALPHISREWKLYMVGPMTNVFQEYVFNQIKDNALEARIKVWGKIDDRRELEKMYVKSTIFAMASRWEGFSLAGVEALARGDYLLTSDLQCFKEMTDNGAYGVLCKNGSKADFRDHLIELCNKIDTGDLQVDYNKMRNYVVNNYSWQKICEKIKVYLGG